jgi:hypothetical protein
MVLMHRNSTDQIALKYLETGLAYIEGKSLCPYLPSFAHIMKFRKHPRVPRNFWSFT